MIDQYTQDILEACLKKLEHETGKKYQLTLNQFESYYVEYNKYYMTQYVMKSFKDYDNYIIYNMDPEYRALEGTYDSYKKIKNKLKYLILEYTKDYKFDPNINCIIWKCPKCHLWGSKDRKNNWTQDDRAYWTSICRNCFERYTSIWNNVKIDIGTGMILYIKYDRLKTHRRIGKIKFE